jgi:acyl-CoA synthetase (AMP-forming)/AMP-acid ligase II
MGGSDAVPVLQGRFETVGEALLAAGEQHGERDAYVEGGRRLSFRAWAAAATGVAAWLREQGIARGDVVAMYLPSCADYAVAYAGIVLAGAVATGINPRLGPTEVSGIVARARPAVVVRDREMAGPAAAALDGIPTLWRHEMQVLGSAPPPGPGGRPDDPAVIIWTSGTTGLPKGAWFDHRNLEAAVASAGVMSAPFDRRLVGTPFPHAGYMAKLWDQLAWGSAIVVSPTPWTAADMLRLIVDERITVAGGVPTQWAKLLELPAVSRIERSDLRLCLVATAPASPQLVRRVEDTFGCPMIVRYAMTESPSITGTEPGDPPEVLQRTVGRPQAGIEVRVVDEAGDAVADGTVGRVEVRGGCVMRGYWGAPELTAAALSPEGWLRSSDLASFDQDGNLVLAGRSDDLYIRGGYNVYPVEVEHVLVDHPGVERVAVVGAPAAVIGEIGVAFVVPSATAEAPTLDELRAWTRSRLADYKAPDELVLVDDLPLTAMQKVDKQSLRGLLSARASGRPSSSPG